jgi:hypothetical protein
MSAPDEPRQAQSQTSDPSAQDAKRPTGDPAWLFGSRANVYSQDGEDGIILGILGVLPGRDRWCVEFGAADGIFVSNSRNLIQNHGYAAILIEGSKPRFAALQQTYSTVSRVTPLNAFVGVGAADGLDALLTPYPIPTDFDFLSIDVDGNDYHIWAAVARYKPKAVCVEFNPTIPTEVRFVQPLDPRVNQGSSLLSLVELGQSKGYELVSVSRLNAFFVDRSYYPLFGITDNRPESLRKDLSQITYLFSGYDGSIHTVGRRELPWHHLPLRDHRLQVLPSALRKFPGTYNWLERVAYWLFVSWYSPRRALQKLRLRGGRGM